MKEKFGNYSVVAMVVSLTIAKVLISAPTLYIQHSQSAGWLEVLLSGLFEIAVLAIFIKLFSVFHNADFFDITTIAFGNIGKVFIGVIYTIVLLVNSAAVFRCFEELVRNTIARGASYENIGLFIGIGGAFAAYWGIKEQLQLVGLILPMLIISSLIILFINFSRLSVVNIQPILGVGFDQIVKNALLKNSSYFEIGSLFLLLPFIKRNKDVKHISFTSLYVSILVLSTITLIYQLAVPYEAAGTFSVPMYQMTRMLKAGTFFQRIEPLNIFIWCGSMFVYVGFGIWAATHIYKKTFNLSDNKPLVLIFTIIVYYLALIPGSETTVERIYDFLMTYSYIFYPIIPTIILIIASFRRKAGNSL